MRRATELGAGAIPEEAGPATLRLLLSPTAPPTIFLGCRAVVNPLFGLQYCIEKKIPRGALQGAPRYYFGALQGAQ